MKILFNIATHGDEKIGEKATKRLTKLKLDKNIFIVQVANKKAFVANKRFIDQDLNRSFPGIKNGNYEQRLAFKLLPIIKSADIVIDLHSTSSDLRNTLIVTKLDKKTKEIVQAIQPKYLLVMNITKNIALKSQAKIGIAFEYGKDNDLKTIYNTELGVKRLLNKVGITNLKLPKSFRSTKYFNVYKTVPKQKGFVLLKNIKNYKLISKGTVYAQKDKEKLIAKEDFYPVLFGEKKYKDIFGFMSKKI